VSGGKGDETMKRLIALVLMVFMASAAASASIGLKGAYFSPWDSDFKSIYGRGWMSGLEITFNITKGLDAWLDGGYFARTGVLTYTQEETKLMLVPIGAGLRYRILTGKVAPYVGAGARYYMYRESNAIGDVNKGGVGFVGKAGVLISIIQGIGIDLSAGYSWCKMKPADFEFNVGGLELGAGIVF
jgi:outer membrane protein W